MCGWWLRSGLGLRRPYGHALPGVRVEVGAFKNVGRQYDKTIQPGFARGKTSQTRFARWKTIQPRLWREENAPLLPPVGGVSPRESVSHDSHSPAAPYESCSLATPEGQILAALCDEMLMRTKAPRRADFPHRGGKGTGFVGKRSDPKIQ